MTRRLQLRIRWNGQTQHEWVPPTYDVCQVHDALDAVFPDGHLLLAQDGKLVLAGQVRHFLPPQRNALFFRAEPAKGLVPYRIGFEGELVWSGRLPPNVHPAEVWRQLIRARGWPAWDECEIEGPPNEPMLRRGQAPERVVPVLPSSVPRLAYWLTRLTERLELFGDVCPRCRASLLDPHSGRCLGRVAVRQGVRTPMRCTYAAPSNPQILEFDDRTDRSRFNGGGGGGLYDPSEHINDVIACRTGRRFTDIPSYVFARVGEALALEGRKPTPHAVFLRLNHLNAYDPDGYSPYYRDSARIASILAAYPTDRPYAFLQKPPPAGAPTCEMPYELGRDLTDMARVACLAWRDAPPQVRNGRVNFFRSDFVLWMLLGCLAAQRDDHRLLQYRFLFANANGERPTLKCPGRDAQYLRQWAWICERVGWTFLL